jgi:cytochrome c-type biogenesis protein CcmH
MLEVVAFWMIVAAALIAVAVSLTVALIRADRGGHSGATSGEAVAEALGAQISQVKSDFEAGLLDRGGLAQSIEDIQRRALEEVGGIQSVPTGIRTGFPLMTGQILAAVIAASSIGLYLHWGSPSVLPFIDSYHASGLMQQDGTLRNVERHVSAEEVEAFLSDNPDNERAWVFLAREYARQDKWDKAESAYTRVMEIGRFSSRDPQVIFEYAACLLGKDDKSAREKAYAELLRALAIDENNLKTAEIVARLEMEMERWGDAREHLELIMRKLGMDNPAYEHYAQMAAYAASMERASRN